MYIFHRVIAATVDISGVRPYSDAGVEKVLVSRLIHFVYTHINLPQAKSKQGILVHVINDFERTNTFKKCSNYHPIKENHSCAVL